MATEPPKPDRTPSRGKSIAPIPIRAMPRFMAIDERDPRTLAVYFPLTVRVKGMNGGRRAKRGRAGG